MRPKILVSMARSHSRTTNTKFLYHKIQYIIICLSAYKVSVSTQFNKRELNDKWIKLEARNGVIGQSNVKDKTQNME
jgi:hypothetical protein